MKQFKKKVLSCIISFLICTAVHSQVGIGTTTPKARLDISIADPSAPSQTDGLLIPRVETFPATNPTINQQGMLVYLTTLSGVNAPGFYYWNNPTSKWVNVAKAAMSYIEDTDQDTKIQVEETADEDVIRFDVAGQEHVVLKPGGKIHVLNTGYSVFLGDEAGASDDGTNNKNTFIGDEAGFRNTSGGDNTAVGFHALTNNTNGNRNTSIGNNSLPSNSGGSNNVAVGFEVLRDNTTGNFNTAIGISAFKSNTIGSNNVGIGVNVGSLNVQGSQNVLIGKDAGAGTAAHSKAKNVMLGSDSGKNNQGNRNVFLGFSSGLNETGSDKLYIENSNSSSPLIYGEFNNDLVRINGDFNATGVISGDGSGLTNINTDDADADVTNEIQNLSDVLTEGNNAGGVNITNVGAITATSFTGDGSGLTNVDNQTLSLSGNNLTISDGNTVNLGTVLPQIVRANVSKNIGNISSDDHLDITFSVPGAQPNSSVIVSPSADLPNQVIIGQARVSAPNTVRVRFHNESNNGKDPAAMVFYITVIK